MIGTALSEKEQMDILNKLDKTDVPWNCAHGRVSLELLNHWIARPVVISNPNSLVPCSLPTSRQ